jgi:hypothetical protein
MNRERAEAHLRLLAEEELRRAAILVRDGAAGRPPGEAMRRASVTGTPAGSGALPGAVMASGGARGAGRGGTGLYSVQYRAPVRLAALLVRDTRAAEQVVQEAFAALRHGGPEPGDTGAALACVRQAVVSRSRLVLRDRSVPGLRRHLVARVARVLAAVGALDDQVAGQILEDFELALAARRARAPGQAGPGSWTRSPPVRPRRARPGTRRRPAPPCRCAGSEAHAGQPVICKRLSRTGRRPKRPPPLKPKQNDQLYSPTSTDKSRSQPAQNGGSRTQTVASDCDTALQRHRTRATYRLRAAALAIATPGCTRFILLCPLGSPAGCPRAVGHGFRTC